MLVRLLNLCISFIDVVSGLDGVFFSVLDDGFLGFDDLGHVGEHGGELGERHFDALELVVASADGAEDGGCLAGAVGFELVIISMNPGSIEFHGFVEYWIVGNMSMQAHAAIEERNI